MNRKDFLNEDGLATKASLKSAAIKDYFSYLKPTLEAAAKIISA
jgi:hypothetical protein